MNDDAKNNTTHQTINIKNQSTPDATISNTSNPSAYAAADIAPNANSLSLGLKTDTDIFLKGNVNNMANKDKINTNPDPGTSRHRPHIGSDGPICTAADPGPD